MGVLKEGNFSGAGCRNMSKGEILLDWVMILTNYGVLEYTFSPIFSTIGYHLKTKLLEPGKKTIFRGHIPVQI